ncbi:MAG: XdhC/CoxI family protein [Acidobacteriota bacterium]|nr:XdhC/CoxI family protein [Acidobacteriota bacterium]
MNHEIFAAIGEALTRGEEVALITIVASHGSTPQRIGAKMLAFADGRTVGTIGGGCYEHDALGKAREALRTRKAVTAKYDLNDDFAEETGLVCGGQMEVFIEPLESSPALYVFGAGHVGYYLGRVASEAGFEVHVLDDRAAFANRERFPFAASVIVEDIPTWLAQASLPPSAYAVVVTRGHRHDLDALAALAPRELRYLGLIGSRAKVARIYDQLLGEGLATLEQLSRVHAPIGLDIGAVTPQEIAVSIAAELVAIRRGKASHIADASLRWMPKAKVPREAGR